MRASLKNLLVSTLALTILTLCCSCEETAKGNKNNQPKQKLNNTAKNNTQELKPTDIAAKVAGYNITREQLSQEALKYNTPKPDQFTLKPKLVDTQTVLMKMIAEKAGITELDKQKYIEQNPPTMRYLNGEKTKLLTNALARKQVESKGPISVSQAEIDAIIKKNPKITPQQADAQIRKQKNRKITDAYYNDILTKLNVKKLTDNYGQAVKTHLRMKLKPAVPRGNKTWVTSTQVDQLVPEEKNLPLVTFNGGTVTVGDLLYHLCEYSPPSRPKTLNSYKEFNKLLDETMTMILWQTEAVNQGLDKEPQYIQQIDKIKQRILRGGNRREALKDLERPTKEQAEKYFKKNKKKFPNPDTIKIDQIWCADYNAAKQASDKIKAGEDFETVKKQYSIDKPAKPTETDVTEQGVFFKELWAAKKGKVIAPVRGFYRGQVMWRVVKILEKTKRKSREYNNKTNRLVRDYMWNEMKDQAIQKRNDQMLGKYPYTIYPEKIKGIDPLNIPKN